MPLRRTSGIVMPDYCASTTPSAFLPMRSIAFCAKPEALHVGDKRRWRIDHRPSASPSDSRWRSAHRNNCRAERAIPAMRVRALASIGTTWLNASAWPEAIRSVAGFVVSTGILDHGRVLDDLLQVLALGASCWHDDAYAGLIDFGKLLIGGGRRHQERRPHADQHWPEIEGCGTILSDAYERHVDLAALEQLDRVRRIVDRYDLVRNAETARQLDTEIGTLRPLSCPSSSTAKYDSIPVPRWSSASWRKLFGGL